MPIRILMVLLLGIAPALPQPVQGCGLEPTFDKGLRVSYPGALKVAMAVAEARRAGLLPLADANAVPDEARLRLMLGDGIWPHDTTEYARFSGL